jgi:choline kinase
MTRNFEEMVDYICKYVAIDKDVLMGNRYTETHYIYSLYYALKRFNEGDIKR